VILTFVIEAAALALIFTKLATLALRLMSATRLSTSSSMRPTESCRTFRRTCGAVEEDVEIFAEVEIVTPPPADAVPERAATFEPLDVVGGVVRTLEVAAAPLLDREVGLRKLLLIVQRCLVGSGAEHLGKGRTDSNETPLLRTKDLETKNQTSECQQ
jgi:hypothetical protein